MKAIRFHLKPYAVAVLAVGSSLLLALLLEPLFKPTIFPLFFAAVAISAWYGGILPGLLATTLSCFAISYFFLNPVFSPVVHGVENLLQFSVFLLVTALISSLNLKLRNANQRLELSMQQLMASEARFRRLADSNIIGVIVADFNGMIVEANDAFLEMVGYSRQDLLSGRVRWRDMTPKEYLEVSDRSIAELREKGVCATFEKEYIRKDGSRVPILQRYALLEDNHEQVIGFVIDLSERKQTEFALKKSEERYRALLEQSSEGIWCFELEVPACLECPEDELIQHFYEYAYLRDCNDVMAQMYGFSRAEEIIGTRLEEFNPPSNPRNIEYLRHFIRSGYRLVDAESHEIDRYGNSKYFLNNLVGIVENGVFVRAWGTQRDITERKRVEDALRESESRFRALADSTIEGVVIHENEKVLDANPAFAKIFGYDFHEVIGKSGADFLTPESHKIAQYNFKIADGKPYELTGIKKDGTHIILEVVGRKCIYQGRSVRVTVVRDITERKRTEIALRESEKRFRRLVESNIFGVACGDLKGGLYYANDYFLNMIGYSREELLSGQVRWNKITPPEYQLLDAQAIEEVKRHGLITPFEKEYIRKDGSRVPIFIGGALLQEPEQQQQETIVFCLDISEREAALRDRKRAEEALRQREEELRLITNAVPVFISYVDAQQRYRFNNKRYEDWYGIPASEINGKHIKEVMGESAYQSVRPYVEAVLRGEQITYETQILSKDGGSRYLNISYVPQFYPGGEVEGFVALISDITERKLTEQEREQLLANEKIARTEAETANRLKDEFLATLSHELRTPLNAMLGWTQLLRSRKFDESITTRALETLDRNTKSLTTLIEDILDVSRIVRGTLHLNLRPVQLASVVEAALDTVRPAAVAKEIHLECRFDPAVGVVIADGNRLQQVVWNLLANAVKFTPVGGRVEVEIERRDSGVQLRVSDTGEGIPANFLPYVFERFRQADSSSTRSHGGLGLGLAIVRHLVELHGGTVTAQSQGIGEGATFIVNLPMKAVEVEINQSEQLLPILRTDEVADNHIPTLEGLRVLVVDDEADTRELLITMLGEYGAEVIAVASVAEALDTLTHFRPDVLVSDIGMPEEDGYTLIRRVRSLPQKQGGSTPAVALTAHARAEDRTKALLAGFQLHVPKPVNPTELVVVVANLAERT